MKQKKKFLQVYLITALIFGFISLADNAFIFLSNTFNSTFAFLDSTNRIYTLVLAILSFLFFFFNLTSLVVFKHQRVEKIAYVLPLYHLLNNVLFVGIGLILNILNTVSNAVWMGVIIAGIICSLFEIGFSSYLLKRFNSPPEVSL
ncbi:MAG: hypothetical protein AABW48_01045 [Nanoarchaeota archaeon]